MVAINWNSEGKRQYEAGLNKGVLYTYGNPGVPWFGLQVIEEAIDGGSIDKYYMDGIPYLMLSTTEEFGAKISAVDYPKEFEPCDGRKSLAKGLTITQQDREPFSFSYQTLIGTDTADAGVHYKIHVVYNAIAKPSNRRHATLQDRPSMESYSWDCEAKPIQFPGVKPFAHLIVESRTSVKSRLTLLEKYLYGSETNDPMLLLPGQIAAVLSGEDVSF